MPTDGWLKGESGRPLSDSAQADAGSSPAPSAKKEGWPSGKATVPKTVDGDSREGSIPSPSATNADWRTHLPLWARLRVADLELPDVWDEEHMWTAEDAEKRFVLLAAYRMLAEARR
jgi:hypothetical protein